MPQLGEFLLSFIFQCFFPVPLGRVTFRFLLSPLGLEGPEGHVISTLCPHDAYCAAFGQPF